MMSCIPARRHLPRLALFLTLSGMTASLPCLAAEGVSPLQPGATTGTPAGALPPAGVYLMVDTAYEHGKLHDGSDKVAVTPAGQKITASNVSAVVALTWVTDKELLGGRYAMAIAQPYKWAGTKLTTDSGSTTTHSNGNINTALTPLILSWNLGGGYFAATSMTIYAKDGDFSSTYSSSANRYVKDSSAVGNNYWTFEPGFAISKMSDGWSYTLNNLLDFNTVNSKTDYRSGMTYYLDATASRRTGKFTYGMLANYTQQITDDKIKGESVPALDGMYSKGNRAEHVLVGPMLGYDFGPFSLTGRILYSVQAKNDADVSFFHTTFSIPLK